VVARRLGFARFALVSEVLSGRSSGRASIDFRRRKGRSSGEQTATKKKTVANDRCHRPANNETDTQ
jgi:hypothetical protein